MTNCYINLKSRPPTNEIDTYGWNYVEIGIPFKTAENLAMALNTDSRYNCVIGGSKSCEEDGCEWINCSLKNRTGKKPPILRMIIDEADHHIFDRPDVTKATVKKEFNRRYKSCRSVINDPEVEDYFLCHLVLEAYGSTVLPKGASPRNTADFEMQIKFYVKVVNLLSNGHRIVGSASVSPRTE